MPAGWKPGDAETTPRWSGVALQMPRQLEKRGGGAGQLPRFIGNRTRVLSACRAEARGRQQPRCAANGGAGGAPQGGSAMLQWTGGWIHLVRVVLRPLCMYIYMCV